MSVAAPAVEAIRRFVENESGVVLGPEKSDAIQSLLAPLALQEGDGRLGALVARVEREPGGEVARAVMEQLLNHETWFFREHHVFGALRREIIPALARRPLAPLRIWSAACSSGQEPYSIAMVLATWFPRLRSSVEIWATDYSEELVERARVGTYSQLEINRGLPAAMLVRHFAEDGEHWRVKPEIRDLVQFGRLNLTESWDELPEMDVILLRNVLLYFGEQTRRELLDKARRKLRPGGCLFLGAAEATFPGESYEATRCGRTSFYRVRGPAGEPVLGVEV